MDLNAKKQAYLGGLLSEYNLMWILNENPDCVYVTCFI